MVYVYYNFKLWVKQIEKAPYTNAISLDVIDTTSVWRVETNKRIMEEAPKWLERDANVLGEGGIKGRSSISSRDTFGRD